jgi:GNAT superfamily N-acetyltransferase
MISNFSIVEVSSEVDLESVKQLFTAYVQWLNIDLRFQQYEEEFNNLPWKYALPLGNLFLAKVDGEPVGCVAIKPFAENVCEMKRLYVPDAYRGLGVARKLVTHCLAWSKKAGYQKMVLDTLRTMTPALSLYKGFGFVETEAYYFNPQPTVVYLMKTF